MNNLQKSMELAKKHMPFCGQPITECTDAVLEMAEWKDSEFEKRVTLSLCIDCCEESCEKCHKYNLKKELLGL